MSGEKRTVRLDSSERYPFYSGVFEPGGYPVEVDAETADRWERVMADFEQVQQEMEVLNRAAQLAAAERARVEQAEAELAAAQMRLEKARHDQEHPPYLAETWPAPGDESCTGWDYVTEAAARAERMRIHDTWGSITFDVVHYWCADGHVHLRRRA